MTSRTLLVVVLAVSLALAGCSSGYAPGVAGSETSEPDADHLGYVDGYWYNDTLDFDTSRGLTDGQKHAIVSRAMARVQIIRGLRFKERAEVDIVTRDEFREEFGGFEGNVTAEANTLDNVEHEALFLVGPDEDAAEIRRSNRGDNVLGFYGHSQERIVIVTEGNVSKFDGEMTLAHELVHALQDQHFNLSSVQGETRDGINARNGLVEGDAVTVERVYERNCETGEWECIDDDSGSPTTGSDFHFGVYFLGFFPYAEGQSFIEHHRDRAGWGAIDAMYDDPPRHSAEIVHPETYGDDRYSEVTIEDRNRGDFERLAPEDTVDHATLGQGGVATMFAYTMYDDYNGSRVIDPEAFLNRDPTNGTLDPDRPFTYDVEYADGWSGDRLHAYTDDNATAYVWYIDWQDEANATEFTDGYERLLVHWDGERVDTRGDATVWRLDDESPFSGAIWIRQDGERVRIVKAPTVDDLDDVYEPAG